MQITSPQVKRTSTASAGPVVLISASIGAGHDGAANEVGRRLEADGNTVLRHDFLDLLPAGWGSAIKLTYARQLELAPSSWGRLLNAVARPRATAAAAALSRYAAERRLLAAIPAGAAAVVSTYPLANQALGRLRLAGRLAAPAVAVMTDPSVHPLCVAAGIDLHLAPNHDATDRIRDGFGLPAVTNSPIVHPDFRPARNAGDVQAGRHRHGLPVRGRLALVVAGSWGVGDIDATVADCLAGLASLGSLASLSDLASLGSLASQSDWAIPVVVCGHNDALRRRLHASGRVIALGWVDDMPSLLRAVDVVVHNAGGLTSLEAMASGVPTISYRCLPGHGVANAAALAGTGLSAWPQTGADLAATLRAALTGDLLRHQQAAYLPLTAARDAATLIQEQFAAAPPLGTPPDAPLATADSRRLLSGAAA